MRSYQRYKCKQCGKNFTQTPLRGVPEKDKLKALVLYASGLSMNRIAQLFGVSTVAVLKWIRTLGSQLCNNIDPSPGDQVIVMEVDEFWHYLKKRNKNSGYSKPMIVMESDSSIGNLVIVQAKRSNDFLNDLKSGMFYFIAVIIGLDLIKLFHKIVLFGEKIKRIASRKIMVVSVTGSQGSGEKPLQTPAH